MKAFFEKITVWYYCNSIYVFLFGVVIAILDNTFNNNVLKGFLSLFFTLMIALFTYFTLSHYKNNRFSSNFPFLLKTRLDSIHKYFLTYIERMNRDNLLFYPLSIFTIIFICLSLVIIFKISILEDYASLIRNTIIQLLYLMVTLMVYDKIIKPVLKIEESLSPHQSKEENLYEELRTRFASHNITKDVRNLKSYITILKHEEPQLLAKFNTLDELTSMIEDTLGKFKNSDAIRTKNPFLVHELFDNFLILNKPDLVREGSDLQIEYQKSEYKNLEIHQIFYEVYQVLNNLIDNARKAIANSDRKEIQILTLVSKEGFVDFRVSDTGVGIDTKARNRVFDIGYSTTNGDGLGLLFVQTTLKRFGGEIQLLPNAISGFSTTFEVRIPTQKLLS